MSNIYLYLKENIEKINYYYRKIGFTFYKDSSWKAPFTGDIILTGIGNADTAFDYELNYTTTMYANRNFLNSFENHLYTEFGKGIQYFGKVTSLNTSVVANSIYNINFHPEVDPKLHVGIRFVTGNKPIYLLYDVDCDENYYLEMSPPEPIDKVFKIGDIYHIESTDKKNPCFLGDCDIKINNYQQGEIDSFVTIEIVKIYRQPSELPHTEQFLTVQYSDDIIQNLDNEYNL